MTMGLHLKKKVPRRDAVLTQAATDRPRISQTTGECPVQLVEHVEEIGDHAVTQRQHRPSGGTHIGHLETAEARGVRGAYAVLGVLQRPARSGAVPSAVTAAR